MQNNLELAQKQNLSQSQIQSLEIMNLCNQDLYTFLNEGYGSEDKEENNREIIPAKQEGMDPATYLKDQLNKSAYTKKDGR